MKKVSFIIFLVLLLTVPVKQIVFADDQDDRLSQICRSRASYELNKEDCDKFFLRQTIEEIDNTTDPVDVGVEKDILSASEVAELYIEGRAKYDKKVKEIKELRAQSKALEEEILAQEDLLLSRLELLVDLQNENALIDFVFGDINFDILMTKISAITRLNELTSETIASLEKQSLKLQDMEVILLEEKNRLSEYNDQLDELMVEFRNREKELYTVSSMASGGAPINAALFDLDAEQFIHKGDWGIPLKSGVVTAVSWNYPASFGGAWHPGIDLATLGSRTGVPVVAPGDGVVLTSGVAQGYGNYVVTIHEKDGYVYTILYAHLQSASDVIVVEKGDTIGYVGMTGITTGPHTHVEVFRHNTNNVNLVIDQFSKTKDFWFGLGYNTTGDCELVCRVHPGEEFNLKMGQTW